ncbi:MAG: 7-cyano-7-deazaguanine synthase [Planctomycetota bacterium]|jgi:hypothetical protein
MSTAERILIDRGDVPSLAALAMEADPSRTVLMHPVMADAAGPRQREVAERHAEVFAVSRLVLRHPGNRDDSLPPPPEPLRLGQELVEATVLARQLDIGRIIDPRQSGPDAGPVGEASDQIAAVTLLAQSGAPRRPIVIDVPLLDLADHQVADLAEDAGAPMQLAWPCRSGGIVPCGDCGGCLRWQAAFEEAGLTWPWSPVAIA